MTQKRDAFGRFTSTNSLRKGRAVEGAAQATFLLRAATSHALSLLILNIYQGVTIGTPVDTGTARSRWIVSTGAPKFDTSQISRDRNTAVLRASVNYSRNQNSAKRVANAYDIRKGKAFIANGAHWIVPLNEGSSAQAPARFVDKVIADAVRAVNASAA